MALAGDGPSLERLELAAEHTYDSRMRKMLHDLQRVGLLMGPAVLQCCAQSIGSGPCSRSSSPLFRSVRLRNRFGRSRPVGSCCAGSMGTILLIRGA